MCYVLIILAHTTKVSGVDANININNKTKGKEQVSKFLQHHICSRLIC